MPLTSPQANEALSIKLFLEFVFIGLLVTQSSPLELFAIITFVKVKSLELILKIPPPVSLAEFSVIVEFVIVEIPW